MAGLNLTEENNRNGRRRWILLHRNGKAVFGNGGGIGWQFVF